MSDGIAGVFSFLFMLGVVLLVGWIVRRGKKRIAVREAHARVLQAEAAHQEAQKDLWVAAKFARGEILTDEELIRISYLAVNSGIATPAQEQVVKTTEALKLTKMHLVQAITTDAVNRS